MNEKEWMKKKLWMKAKSSFGTFPSVKFDKRMFLRVLPQIQSLDFIYKHWFWGIHLVSTQKEKYFPDILIHLSV